MTIIVIGVEKIRPYGSKVVLKTLPPAALLLYVFHNNNHHHHFLLRQQFMLGNYSFQIKALDPVNNTVQEGYQFVKPIKIAMFYDVGNLVQANEKHVNNELTKGRRRSSIVSVGPRKRDLVSMLFLMAEIIRSLVELWSTVT